MIDLKNVDFSTIANTLATINLSELSTNLKNELLLRGFKDFLSKGSAKVVVSDRVEYKAHLTHITHNAVKLNTLKGALSKNAVPAPIMLGVFELLKIALRQISEFEKCENVESILKIAKTLNNASAKKIINAVLCYKAV